VHHRCLAGLARVPATSAALALGQHFGGAGAGREQCPAAQVSGHVRPGQERHAVPGVSGRVGQWHQRQQVPGRRHAAEQYPHVFLSLVGDVVSGPGSEPFRAQRPAMRMDLWRRAGAPDGDGEHRIAGQLDGTLPHDRGLGQEPGQPDGQVADRAAPVSMAFEVASGLPELRLRPAEPRFPG
jgi:hypothetical protein